MDTIFTFTAHTFQLVMTISFFLRRGFQKIYWRPIIFLFMASNYLLRHFCYNINTNVVMSSFFFWFFINIAIHSNDTIVENNYFGDGKKTQFFFLILIKAMVLQLDPMLVGWKISFFFWYLILCGYISSFEFSAEQFCHVFLVLQISQ